MLSKIFIRKTGSKISILLRILVGFVNKLQLALAI